MDLSYPSIIEHGLESSAAILTAGFSDYFVSVHMTAPSLLAMVRQDSVDLQLSRVILQDERPIGAALIARRGWTSRLAAMAVVPTGRAQGIGTRCMQELLEQARARGDHAMTLEVIEQNAPAVRLYEKYGFTKMRRLIGFEGKPRLETDKSDLQSVDVREIARILTAHGGDDLPWQLTGETLAQAGPPNVAYNIGSSYIALSDPNAPTIAIRAIITLPDARRQGHALHLLRAVIARHPGKTWRVPALFSEEIGALFTQAGLTRSETSQWQMTAAL